MKGIHADWQNLTRRKCDYCGELYQPKRPLRGKERGFCCDNHRKDFHKHGGSYAKLKPFIESEIKKRIKELSPADATRIDALEARIEKLEDINEALRVTLNYRRHTP